MLSIFHSCEPAVFLLLPQKRKEPVIEHTPIFNSDELMLIRAALRFWRDEMPTNDLSLAASYFAQEERSSLPESVDVALLLERLEYCRIRFVIFDPDHKMILHSRLFDSVTDAKQNCADHLAIATAIVPA